MASQATRVKKATTSFDVPLTLFTPATGPKGTSVPVATRVPLELVHSMEEIIQSKGSPWKTKSEFIRDAIFSFIRKVSKEGEVGDVTPQIVATLLLWQRQNFERKTTQMIANAVISATEEMQIYLDFGELGDLSTCLEDACTAALKIESNFWFKRTAKAIFDSINIRRAAENLKDKGLLGAASARVYDTWKVIHASTSNS